MQRIIPHLWYDKEAKEAAEFYVRVFGGDSRVTNVTTISGTPSGDADIVSFTLLGLDFMSISAGPYFKPTPAISFLVACDTKEEVERLWHELSDGGEVLMPLESYPFSERYGWTSDKYGFSWQILYAGEGAIAQRITPTLMFVGDVCGKALEAAKKYTALFPDSALGDVQHYPKEMPNEAPDNVMHMDFTLCGQGFGAMDSGQEHKFNFNEAISLMVRCDTQAEIDTYWDALSAVPEAEQCGWLKDEYGVSWQIVPTAMDDMMTSGDEAARGRVTKSFLQMKKFDLSELEKAFKGE